jgi:hypothetical protein
LDDLAIYLRLAPEFGGTRFGPFEGAEIRLGCEAEKNDIVLPEALGVINSHVKILRQSEKNIILAPVDRTAAVFLFQGKRPPRQVTTNIAISPGDAFSLVTAQGPRFIMELDELPEELKKEREKQRSNGRRWNRLSPKEFGREGKRQAWMYALTTGPGRWIQRGYVFVVSGAIFMPRNLIMIAMIGGGYAMAGGQRCSNVGLKSDLADSSASLESCNDQVAFAENMSGADSAGYSFTVLSVSITGVAQLGPALENDPTLTALVKERAAVIFRNSKQYEWLTNPSKSSGRAGVFATFRESLADDLPSDTARIMAYVAARPDLSRGSDTWAVFTDSEGDDVCGRGPTALTYRQGLNLGLKPQLDGLIIKNVSDFQGPEGREKREELLKETAARAGVNDLDELDEDVEAKLMPIKQGGKHCVVLDGPDGRRTVSQMVKAMDKQLGDSGKGLPPSDVNYGVTARIAKLFVADWVTVDFDERDMGFDLSEAPPGSILPEAGPRGDWAMRQTADVIARSMVLPCVAVLNHADNPAVATTLGDPLPSPINCLVLDWKLRHGE